MRASILSLLCLTLSIGCKTQPTSEVQGTIEIGEKDRTTLIQKGHVLYETENLVRRFTPEAIRRGPTKQDFTRLAQAGEIPFPGTLSCTFKEPDPKDKMGGMSRKFECVDEAGKTLKVKYGVDNPEVYYEVLVSRLLWVLGFYADRYYPVYVTCKNCPEDPWGYIQKAYDLDAKGASAAAVESELKKEKRLASQAFHEAIIESKTGDKLEVLSTGESGWGFNELRPLSLPDDSRCATGRCERIYREALIILASFILHMDNKNGNQKVFCVEDGNKKKTECPDEQVGLMIHDGGASFLGYQFDVLGRILPVPASTELKLWSLRSVWKNGEPCKISIPTTPWGIGSDQSLVEATVSEPARAFLADRLKDLTADQLDALLDASRLDQRKEPSETVNNLENRKYQRAFRDALAAKMKEITETTCKIGLQFDISKYP